ncbi:putative transporter [Cyphellophora attinorum]|uniref:Putative transporter n=1 Tax=Cyphellophora attinorum TaxID=1664694 RepID=A0A0N1HAB2_9EURO|nr:putative transporter [Phialophora attinorum]KPI44864.1 putative transporter [Phialophora attinorum]
MDLNSERPSDNVVHRSTTTGKVDVAADVVGTEAQQYDAAIERRVIRRIDLFVIPFLWIGYGFVYYDKAILGGASIFGLITALDLRVVVDPTTTPPKTSTQRLSWASSLFYFGMLAGVIPLTYAFQRLHLSRTIGACVVIWGLTCMATALVTTHQGLYVQRFFLGFLESMLPTAFMVIVSSFYTQKEQTWRQCLWYSATGGWTVIGAGLNYGFASINSGNLQRWQYLYIMAGALTVLYGLLFFLFPQTPNTAFFLHGQEKTIALERLRRSQMGVRCNTIKGSQIKEALTDPKVYLIALMMGLAYTVNGAVSAFGPLIVSTFGYSPLTAILWQMPLGGVCFVTILLCGYLSLIIPNIRLIMIIFNCLPVMAGCAMIWKSSWTHHAATPLAGYTLIGFFAPVTSLIVSMGMVNVAGNTKKSAMASATFFMYCVGNIVGPFWIKTEQVAQHYPMLWKGILGSYSVLVLVAAILYIMLRRENQRRDATGLDQQEGEKHAFEDLTDKENPWFRYAY